MAVGHNISAGQGKDGGTTKRAGEVVGEGLREGLGAVLDVIRRGRRFAVCSHARPDGDAVGAMLSCGMMLVQLGKHAELVSADAVPQIYRGMPCASNIRHTARLEGEYDAVILLECDGIERSRLGGLEGRFLVNMDHHATGRAFADVNWIDTHACAVAEMVYRLAMAAGAEVTPQMASCLYAGVLTDTGAFCYEGTDAHAFELARELVGRGADPAAIAREVYFSNPLSKMLLLGAALSNLRRHGTDRRGGGRLRGNRQLRYWDWRRGGCGSAARAARSSRAALAAQQGRAGCGAHRGQLRWRRASARGWLHARRSAARGHGENSGDDAARANDHGSGSIRIDGRIQPESGRLTQSWCIRIPEAGRELLSRVYPARA
jgi:hypothetical protein